MELVVDYAALFDNLDRAHREAAEDTLKRIKEQQPVVTGELRDSYHLVEHESARSHPEQGARRRKIFIVSSAPHANAVEWGADTREIRSVRAGTLGKGIYVIRNGRRKLIGRQAAARERGSRKGPHMKGNHVVASQGPTFLEHMGYRLSEANR